MADYPDYYSYLGQGDYPSGGGDYTSTAQMDPEQFLRQGAYTPTDLTAINTMAGGGSSGGGGGYSYALAPELTQTAYASPATAGVPTPPTQPSLGNRMLTSLQRNPWAALAMLGGAGTGLAGLVNNNASPTLPRQVNTALKQAQTGTGGPQDPNAQYRYDLARAQTAAQLAKEMGPGWATSTPGIQKMAELERTINADVYSRQLGQQQLGLQTVNALTQPLLARQAASAQGLGQLAGTLGTLGYLGLS